MSRQPQPLTQRYTLIQANNLLSKLHNRAARLLRVALDKNQGTVGNMFDATRMTRRAIKIMHDAFEPVGL